MNGPWRQETAPARTDTRWHVEVPGVLAWGVWAEKVPEHGEDAEPLLEHHVASGRGVVGVFDGAGGAGSSVARTDSSGRRASSAWVASRVAALVTGEWFRTTVSQPALDEEDEVGQLERELGDALSLMRPGERSRLNGRMVRPMPTTMAAVTYCLRGDRVEARALWAGDSRVYALDPGHGLMALTRDHTDEQDALEQIRQDPPMTNMLTASGRFRVQTSRTALSAPVVLVCATDGFFGHVVTPHLFELHLLRALEAAADAESLGALLEERVRGYTADDATLAAVALGFDSFEDVRTAYLGRLHTLVDEYGPVPPVQDAEDHRRWQEESWRRYRTAYETLMPPQKEETP
ncbi:MULTISPECIES: protein phosphatase 2C domain-containing protein [unclassified Nocardiopsis]|uniref:protein phosphatase 2C domain-containing protein n=1 Tax=unclassified Nocardiopsis TaxID=2649073 RepID=UPI00135A1F88|nr:MULTISPECIES: protein phosphatase 2C domain-containing protein [unclassified Nocardiopsis]